MNINIDLGNIWEALSAIGTTSAVIVSLWLARRDERRKLSVKMMLTYGIKMDNTIENTTFLSIDAFNEGKQILTIEEVGFVKRKKGKKMVITDSNLFMEGSSGLNFKIEPNSSAMYILERERMQIEVHQRWGGRSRVRAYVRDSSGKKHFSKRHKI